MRPGRELMGAEMKPMLLKVILFAPRTAGGAAGVLRLFPPRARRCIMRVGSTENRRVRQRGWGGGGGGFRHAPPRSTRLSCGGKGHTLSSVCLFLLALLFPPVPELFLFLLFTASATPPPPPPLGCAPYKWSAVVNSKLRCQIRSQRRLLSQHQSCLFALAGSYFLPFRHPQTRFPSPCLSPRLHPGAPLL